METRLNLTTNPLGARIAKRMYSVSQEVEKSTLSKATQDLVMLRASQINGCGFCIDIHTKEAASVGETALRLHLVAGWRHAVVFTEAERAALALTEEGTRLADFGHGVSDGTWNQLRAHYDDDQIIALVTVVAMINASNRFGVILNQQGGAYQHGALAGAVS